MGRRIFLSKLFLWLVAVVCQFEVLYSPYMSIQPIRHFFILQATKQRDAREPIINQLNRAMVFGKE